VIAAQLQTQRLGDTFARQIVLGGAKASGKDHDLSAGKRGPARQQEVLGTISNNGFENYLNSKLVKTLGQEQGISVLAVRRQHLGANRYDLCIHGY
jgi:hypothetical protein